MERPTRKINVMVLVLAMVLPTAAFSQTDPAIDLKHTLPAGARYPATAPDTLDLAERARLAVAGLTRFLNPQANHAPYGHWYFNNPPYLSDLAGGPPNWGKIAESLILARLMCGSEENLDIQQKMLAGMLSPPVQREPNRGAYAPDYMTINPAAPTPLSRVMLALTALYQLDPQADLERRLRQMAEDHIQAVQYEGDRAYYSHSPAARDETMLGVLGHWLDVFINGCAIRALVRWSRLRDDDRCLAVAGKLGNDLLQAGYWVPQAAPPVVATAERGHFSGHLHAYTQALMGLLWYADATRNARLQAFVRSSYEYIRNFGIARIGLFGEACTTGDMTVLALKLSQMGAGDYWEDADQYVRNHLAELQITDVDQLRRATRTMPAGRGCWDPAHGPLDPLGESAEQVCERTVGTFLSDATHPALIPAQSFMCTICCTGNCTPALYYAWESIVRGEGDSAQVHLLLNRASPWLDLDSYLPYEGKVVIRNKNVRRLSVRLPAWADQAAVQSRVDGRRSDAFRVGRYLVFDSLKPGATVTITFPMVETTEAYTLRWKQSEFWQESNHPGAAWEPLDPPERYTCRFRGNTLVDIAPRPQEPGYPLYQREKLRRHRAPMRQVRRYVPSQWVTW